MVPCTCEHFCNTAYSCRSRRCQACVVLCCEMHARHACHMHEPGTDARIWTCDVWWAGGEHICNEVWCICLSNRLWANHASKNAGRTVAWAEQNKRTRFRKDVPDHAAFLIVLFAIETCGYMGKMGVKFVNRLGDIAAESCRIPKGAFVRWAMQLLSVTVHRVNAEILESRYSTTVSSPPRHAAA